MTATPEELRALLSDAKTYVHAYAMEHKGDGSRATEFALALHRRMLAALTPAPEPQPLRDLIGEPLSDRFFGPTNGS